MTTTMIDERAQQEAEEERLEYLLHLLKKVWLMERRSSLKSWGTTLALAYELGIGEQWRAYRDELEDTNGQK